MSCKLVESVNRWKVETFLGHLSYVRAKYVTVSLSASVFPHQEWKSSRRPTFLPSYPISLSLSSGSIHNPRLFGVELRNGTEARTDVHNYSQECWKMATAAAGWTADHRTLLEIPYEAL